MTSGAEVEDSRETPSAGPSAAAYLATLVVYIGLGYVLKSVVLNWIVGPLFLLVALYLLPRLVRSVPSNHTG